MQTKLTALLLLASTAVAGPAFAQIPTRTLPGAPASTMPGQQQTMPTAPQTTPAAPLSAPTAVEGVGVAAPEGYKIGHDDVIEVDVLGQSDFKTRARVSSDGTVTLPYLGDFPVAGETTKTLADKLEKALKAGGYYAKPIVSVQIISFVSNYVVVLGQVGAAGLQPVDRGYHVSEIIARAGGLKPTAGEYVVLTHQDGTSQKLDYEKLAQGGPDDDPIVKPGDKVFVPEVEQFYIYGAVNAPGVYGLRSDMTLRRALARGGGLAPSGSAKRVKVSRDGKEIKLGMDDPILPGDVVVVGERAF